MAARHATLAEVLALAPELTGREARISHWLTFTADTHIGLAAWTTTASQGHAALVAHIVTSEPGSAASGGVEAGPIVSAALGPSSVSFAAPQLTDEYLSTTWYGRLYQDLCRGIDGRGTGIVARREWSP